MTVNGTHIYSANAYPVGTILEFEATFTNAGFQNIGFSIDQAFDGNPWITIGEGETPDGNLYARTSAGASVLIGSNLLGAQHKYRIEWLSDKFDFFVDDAVQAVASIPLTVTGNLYVQVSDVYNNDGSLSVDWLRVLPYTTAGTYTSRVFDAGTRKAWTNLLWNADVPSGASLQLYIRKGATPTPDPTWTAFTAISASGDIIGGPAARYIQYKAEFTAGNGKTPVLHRVAINCTNTAAGELPPVISGVQAIPGSGSATISWTTDEPADSKVIYGSNPNNLAVTKTTTALVVDHSLLLTGLTPGATYFFKVISSTETAQTTTYPAAQETPLSFNVPAIVAACFTDQLLSDFNAGTPSGTIVRATNAGAELLLAPTQFVDFSAIPPTTAWNSFGWTSNGAATVQAGRLEVNGARYNSEPEAALYLPGTGLEAVANFGAEPFQHLGFGGGSDATGNGGIYNGEFPWAMFSTGSTSNTILARTFIPGVATEDFQIPNSSTLIGTDHLYRILWKTGGTFEYYIDNILVHTTTIVITTGMRPAISDYTLDNISLSVDEISLLPYSTSGAFLSRIFDAGELREWGAVNWTSQTPSGTQLAIEVRTGNTATPDNTWTAFTLLAASGAAVDRESRYIQYRVTMSTNDAGLTPTFGGIDFSCGNPETLLANYRTKTNGNLSQLATWEVYLQNQWQAATQLPGPGNQVSILHNVLFDIDYLVGDQGALTLNGVGTLTVAPGKSLTIAGTGNFNDQPVTFRSDATGTAMLGIVSGSLSGATNVTIERYLPARRTWRILTAPLTNTGSVFANWQNNGSATGTTGAEIWAPGATSGSGLTAAGNAPSMQYFDYLSNKWVNVTDTKGTSLSGTTNQGFSIFVTGPFGSPNYITSGSAPTTLVAHGALQVGNHQALYANPAGHYILVPNPYAAPVDFAKVTRSSNIPDGFWAWDPTLGGTGSYATVSKDGSAYDIAPASSAQTQVIQNGQAVFVKSTDNTAASLTFHEADKDISKASGQVFRQAGTASKLYINLNKLVNNTPKIADGVLAKFGEGYKAEAGSDDAAKLFGNEENIAIRRSGAYLSIERRPDVVKYDTLFLNIFKMKAGPYSLEVKPDNFDITGLKATIRDKFLNTQTTVDLINGTTLTFMVTTDAASYAADRFIVVFEQQKVLAVTFTGLKAFELNGNVQVEWQMAEAPDADYYEVERSLDGRSFTVAAQLAAKHSGATESYAWLDKQAQAGTNYYRITMYTKEAAVLKSSIVQVVLAKGAPAIAAFPNPVVNRLVQLQLRNMQTGSYVISIYNTAGIQVAAKKVTLTTPNATQTLTLPKGTAAGNYQAVIKDAQGHQWYQPIAVQ